MVISHKIHFVGLNIPVFITRQGDILELGLNCFCLLLIYAEKKTITLFPIDTRPYIKDNVVHTCNTFMMVNAHVHVARATVFPLLLLIISML